MKYLGLYKLLAKFSSLDYETQETVSCSLSTGASLSSFILLLSHLEAISQISYSRTSDVPLNILSALFPLCLVRRKLLHIKKNIYICHPDSPDNLYFKGCAPECINEISFCCKIYQGNKELQLEHLQEAIIWPF